MSNIDELPSWAGRAVGPGGVGPSNVPPEPQASPAPKRRRGLLLGLLGLVAVAVAAGGAYWLSSRDDGSVATDSPTLSAVTSTPASGGQVAAGPTATTAPTTAATSATTAASTTTSTAATSSTAAGSTATVGPTPDNPEGAIRYATFKGGQVHLRGRVPSQEVAKAIQTKTALVVGPDNVFNEYTIDPSVPVDVPGPIYVEDTILFAFNSVKIEPAFTPILDLGIKLMTLNPKVTVKVVAQTDAVGSSTANLRVSQQRAQAVIDYWTRKGIDPSRVTADARGETGASEKDDPQTAALNRRAEFIISGLLDG